MVPVGGRHEIEGEMEKYSFQRENNEYNTGRTSTCKAIGKNLS